MATIFAFILGFATVSLTQNDGLTLKQAEQMGKPVSEARAKQLQQEAIQCYFKIKDKQDADLKAAKAKEARELKEKRTK